VDELLQLLMTTSDKNDSAKLAALRVFQEAAPKLLSDPNRLEATVTTLKTIFQQFRNSGSPLVCSQILCSMTSIVIEMELFVEKDHQLIDLIQLLLEVAGKMKSETHLLLRATACDCLRELELAYPGILSSKIGHFYAMSQSETAHVFQHYLADRVLYVCSCYWLLYWSIL
jgi:AP-5 complex subunit beta-1